MALLSISSSDLADSGWNTAVGCGVLASPAITMAFVNGLAFVFFMTSRLRNDWATKGAIGVGVASIPISFLVSCAVCLAIPGSRFALIADDSISKMLKLAVLQGIAGAVIDYLVSKKPNIATAVGLCGALATYIGPLPFVALGALGTKLGVEFVLSGR